MSDVLRPDCSWKTHNQKLGQFRSRVRSNARIRHHLQSKGTGPPGVQRLPLGGMKAQWAGGW